MRGTRHSEIDDASLEEFDQFTRHLAVQAGTIVMDFFMKPHQVTYKSGDRRNPVTEADHASEEYLVKEIEDQYPEHAILGEEGQDREFTSSPFLWVLDPLDGTTNFLNGVPIFAVSIALLYEGRPITGCIYIPYPARDQGSLFHAKLGGGTFQDENPVTVAGAAKPGAGHIAILPGRYSRFLSFKKPMTANHGEVRALGSICYEATLVCHGVAQYSLFTGPRLWDVAAAALLVREAGGLVLIGQGLGSWEPFESFPYPYLGEDKNGTLLRQWSRPIVIGNSAVSSFVAARVKRKPMFRMRFRRWLKRRIFRRGN